MNVVPSAGDFWHLNEASTRVEQALIGICMMEPSAFTAAQPWLSAHHFSENVHRHIWDAMEGLSDEGRPVTPITVVNRVGNVKLGDISLHAYIARCAADTSCPAPYVVDHARQIRDHWCLREIAHIASDARSSALAPGGQARGILGDLMQKLDETRAVADGRVTLSRSVGAAADALVTRINGIRSGEIKDRVVTTCLRDLDRKLNGGFRPGELIVIAGRPGMGKSVIAVSVSRQAAAAGHPGALFSLEMPERQISARMLADEAYSGATSLSAGQIASGNLTDTDVLKLDNAQRALNGIPLVLDCSPSLTVGEVGARTRTLMKRLERQGKRLEFIAIDYLKFLRASDRYRGQRVLEVGEITGGLKSLAKDLEISVILLAQLNRQNEQTQDKKPDLSHLRESGEIEQDADVVLLLFREAYYLSKDPNAMSDPEKAARYSIVANQLDIIIAKNRMGQTGVITVFCHPGASAVRDLMQGYG